MTIFLEFSWNSLQHSTLLAKFFFIKTFHCWCLWYCVLLVFSLASWAFFLFFFSRSFFISYLLNTRVQHWVVIALSFLSLYLYLNSFVLLAITSMLVTPSLIRTELQNITSQLHSGQPKDVLPALLTQYFLNQILVLSPSLLSFSCSPYFWLLMLSKLSTLRTLELPISSPTL